MPGRQQRTQSSFREELPSLLEESGTSIRQLARDIDLPQSYISRVLHGDRAASKNLLGRAAAELGLPVDYFPEYRELVAIEAIKSDPRLRERIYEQTLKR